MSALIRLESALMIKNKNIQLSGNIWRDLAQMEIQKWPKGITIAASGVQPIGYSMFIITGCNWEVWWHTMVVFTWDALWSLPRQEAETEAASRSLVPDAVPPVGSRHKQLFTLTCCVQTEWKGFPFSAGLHVSLATPGPDLVPTTVNHHPGWCQALWGLIAAQRGSILN